MMSKVKSGATQATARRKNGFAVHVLRNDRVEIAIVPELGARIISLKNRRTGREWMWRPTGGLKLFRNRAGDDFSRSPLAGLDECLPTIAPCRWRGRELPDHGEVWSGSWTVDSDAWKTGALKTSIALNISPFHFERTIQLRKNEILFDYQLHNRGPRTEFFLWAMHPLLTMRRGDRVILPKSTRALLNGGSWKDDLQLAIPNGSYDKSFASPLSEGSAGIFNRIASDRLDFDWCPVENSVLGLWINRGGWHGHQHMAIEPTNGAADALTVAAGKKRCGRVAARGLASWQVRFRVGP